MTKSTIKTYRDLIVWDKAVDLAVAVHHFSEGRSRSGFHALADQMNRAAISVPSNIAEGFGRYNRGDYMRFVGIANGSLCELETDLVIASRFRPVWTGETDRLLESSHEVGRMLAALHRALRKAPLKPG